MQTPDPGNIWYSYFGLRENPFAISPDPNYLLSTHQHHEAIQTIIRGIETYAPFLLLTGDTGTGKTTVCRLLMRKFSPEKVQTALVLNPINEEAMLFKSIMIEFGLPTEGDQVDQLNRFNAFLLQNYRAGKKTVLMIDDAQILADEVLEGIRMLSNFEFSNRKLLQIMLVGQTELKKRLLQPHMRQMHHRITIRYHITPITFSDIERYVTHRMKQGGCEQPPPFTAFALLWLFMKTRGNPRHINILCEKALMSAYADQKLRISASHILDAARDVRGS